MSTSPAWPLDWARVIRTRPGMYVGWPDARGLRYLLIEIVHEAVANARAADAGPRVEVDLLPEAGFTVRDNGPGRGAPAMPPGLHSLDWSNRVANALARRLVIEHQREGQLWREEHAAGAVLAPPAPFGATSVTGTAITFWPDPQMFHDTGAIDSTQISQLLETLACLYPTGTFLLRDRRGQAVTEERFEAPEGLAHLIRLLESPFTPPVHPTIVRGTLRTAAGEATVAFRWCRDVKETVTLFANDRRMPYGGTPVVGLRTGVPHAIRRFARALPAGTIVPTGLAYRSGLVAFIAVRVEEPMFLGATHGQLGNREAAPLVAAAARRALETFLREHPDEARAILAHLADPRRADPKTGMPL